LLRLVIRCSTDPAKIWIGCTILIAGHHFIPYAKEVVQRVEGDIAEINNEELGQVKGEVPEVRNRPMPVASDF
jgi:xanthosine utilization system XapX-like protein